MNNDDLYTQRLTEVELRYVVGQLLNSSQWFQVDPRGDNSFGVTVKAEAKDRLEKLVKLYADQHKFVAIWTDDSSDGLITQRSKVCDTPIQAERFIIQCKEDTGYTVELENQFGSYFEWVTQCSEPWGFEWDIIPVCVKP